MAAKKQTKTAVVAETLSEKAKRLFTIYPEKEELHLTSDGLAFEQYCNAANHAKTLKSSEIKTFKNE